MESFPQAAASWPEDFGRSAKNPVKVFESENLSCFTVSFDTIIPGFKLIPGSSEKSRGRGKQARSIPGTDLLIIAATLKMGYQS